VTIETNTDVNIRKSEGDPALKEVAMYGHIKAINYLLSRNKFEC
jgi:hypothetical protein